MPAQSGAWHGQAHSCISLPGFVGLQDLLVLHEDPWRGLNRGRAKLQPQRSCQRSRRKSRLRSNQLLRTSPARKSQQVASAASRMPGAAQFSALLVHMQQQQSFRVPRLLCFNTSPARAPASVWLNPVHLAATCMVHAPQTFATSNLPSRTPGLLCRSAASKRIDLHLRRGALSLIAQLCRLATFGIVTWGV